MALELLYPIDWIEKKRGYGFLLGISYSIVGIASAMFLFPENPGLAAIAFTSLLLMPSLIELLKIEELQAEYFDWNFWRLYEMHKDIIGVYLFIFLGIMFSFAFFSLMLPEVASSQIFHEQVGYLGRAYSVGSFGEIFWNNFLVFVITLVASLIYGSGAIFVITWNASVWGSVFGMVANNFHKFFLTMIAVFPHMILEALAYIFAAVAGGMLSVSVIKGFNKNVWKDSFMLICFGLVFLVLGAMAEIWINVPLRNLLGI